MSAHSPDSPEGKMSHSIPKDIILKYVAHRACTHISTVCVLAQVVACYVGRHRAAVCADCLQ